LETVKRIRTMRGMNQVDLARASGVAQNTISEIETGRREARPGTLAKLAKALNVEIADFFEEVERPKALSEPLSFRRWLEDRFGHSYLALSEEEIVAMFEGFSVQEDEEERKRKLFDAITAEYLATAKTLNLPKEERVLVRGYHKEATSKWDVAATASGQWERVDEEFERSIEEAREASAESEPA
jgi:transcriptional regulator with XRE-family HTH domain